VSTARIRRKSATGHGPPADDAHGGDSQVSRKLGSAPRPSWCGPACHFDELIQVIFCPAWGSVPGQLAPAGPFPDGCLGHACRECGELRGHGSPGRGWAASRRSMRHAGTPDRPLSWRASCSHWRACHTCPAAQRTSTEDDLPSAPRTAVMVLSQPRSTHRPSSMSREGPLRLTSRADAATARSSSAKQDPA
jgi:hypothetical protein